MKFGHWVLQYMHSSCRRFTIQPASAFKETISTVKEGEETDKSESPSSVFKVCDSIIENLPYNCQSHSGTVNEEKIIKDCRCGVDIKPLHNYVVDPFLLGRGVSSI